jgi:hypothetical protein
MGISMFSATSGWGSIVSASNPSSSTGVAYTVDGGRTWTNVTPAGLTGLPLEYPSTIALSTRSATQAWSWLASFHGNTTTLWRTLDAGAHWSPYTVATTQVEQLDFSDSLHGWLSADPYGAAAGEYPMNVWRTTDGGAAWTQVSSYPVVGGTTGISFANGATGFAGGCPAGGRPSSPVDLCVTHDAGNTWSGQPSPTPVQGAVAVEPPIFISATAGVLEMTKSQGGPEILYLYRTTDAGMTWHEVMSLGGFSAFSVTANGALSSVAPTGEVFVASTVNGQITLYQLPLGASKWTQIATAGSSTALLAGMTQLDFVNQMTGWAVTSAGLIATLDGGVTWAAQHA